MLFEVMRDSSLWATRLCSATQPSELADHMKEC